MKKIRNNRAKIFEQPFFYYLILNTLHSLRFGVSKYFLILLTLTTTVIYSCGQSLKPTPNNNTSNVLIDSITNIGNLKTVDFSFDNYVHTEVDYTDTTGKGIIIQNSYPRGGGYIYTSNKMQQYGHAVFWSRIINKTEKPLTFNIHFPADSLIIYPSHQAHFKLLVPSDTMTLDKVSVYSFGLNGIDTFVENNFHQSSELERVIYPNEESIFYVILLSHLSTSDKGISRTGLFLEGQELFYKLTVNSSISKLLPCGRITFEE